MKLSGPRRADRSLAGARPIAVILATTPRKASVARGSLATTRPSRSGRVFVFVRSEPRAARSSCRETLAEGPAIAGATALRTTRRSSTSSSARTTDFGPWSTRCVRGTRDEGPHGCGAVDAPEAGGQGAHLRMPLTDVAPHVDG